MQSDLNWYGSYNLYLVHQVAEILMFWLQGTAPGLAGIKKYAVFVFYYLSKNPVSQDCERHLSQ